MSCPAAVDITAPALKELVECVSGTGQRALPRVAFEAFLSPVLSGVLGKKGPATDHPPSWVSSNSGLEGGEFAKSDLATLLLVHRAGRGYDILTNSEFVSPPRTKLMARKPKRAHRKQSGPRWHGAAKSNICEVHPTLASSAPHTNNSRTLSKRSLTSCLHPEAS